MLEISQLELLHHEVSTLLISNNDKRYLINTVDALGKLWWNDVGEFVGGNKNHKSWTGLVAVGEVERAIFIVFGVLSIIAVSHEPLWFRFGTSESGRSYKRSYLTMRCPRYELSFLWPAGPICKHLSFRKTLRDQKMTIAPKHHSDFFNCNFFKLAIVIPLWSDSWSCVSYNAAYTMEFPFFTMAPPFINIVEISFTSSVSLSSLRHYKNLHIHQKVTFSSIFSASLARLFSK